MIYLNSILHPMLNAQYFKRTSLREKYDQPLRIYLLVGILEIYLRPVGDHHVHISLLRAFQSGSSVLSAIQQEDKSLDFNNRTTFRTSRSRNFLLLPDSELEQACNRKQLINRESSTLTNKLLLITLFPNYSNRFTLITLTS